MPKKKKVGKRYAPKRTPLEQWRRSLAIRRALFSVVIVAIVASIIFFLVLRNESDISLAENGIGSVFSRVQNVFTNATNGVREFTTRWHNYDQLVEEYNDLTKENQQLSLQLTSADEAILENERLKTLLDAKDRYEALDPIYAKVSSRDAGQWFETFSINRGSSDGISTGMAVVNGDGLIGRVYETGMNYAKVICIIDTRSSVACMVQRTRDNGIMRGEIMNSADVAECYVYYLPNLNNITPGNTVVTSGTDSLYPKGLNIGVITAVCMEAGSEGSYAIVTPSVDFHHIEEVFVLRQVIETDSDLPSLMTPTPQPTTSATHGPDITPTPSPTPSEGIWSYPGTAQTLEPLLEDDWVRN